MILFLKTTTATLYDFSRLVLPPIVDQLHNKNTELVWWVVVVGGTNHYVVFCINLNITYNSKSALNEIVYLIKSE